MMHSKLIASAVFLVCLLQLGTMIFSVEAGQETNDYKDSTNFILKVSWDLTKHKVDMLNEGVLKKYPPTTKLELTAPGYFDYIYLAYDIAIPLIEYHNGTLTEKELCKRWFGALGGFGGSVIATPLGAFVGTLVIPWPGWGTMIGAVAGGQRGYYAGKEVGSEFIGEHICESLI